MGGIEKQGGTGMAYRKRMLLVGRVAFRLMLYPSACSYCEAEASNGHEFSIEAKGQCFESWQLIKRT